jgi:hypothetical protein
VTKSASACTFSHERNLTPVNQAARKAKKLILLAENSELHVSRCQGTRLAIAACGTTFDLTGVPQASGIRGQTKTLRMALTSAVGSKEM